MTAAICCPIVEVVHDDDGGESGVRSICWLKRRFACRPLEPTRDQFNDISPIANSDATTKDLNKLYAVVDSLRATDDAESCYFVDSARRVKFCGHRMYLQRLIYMLCAKTYGHTDKIGSRCPCPVQSFDDNGLLIVQSPTMTECPNAQRCCANPRHIYLQHKGLPLRKRNIEALDAEFIVTDAMRVEHYCETALLERRQPRALRTQTPAPRPLCTVPTRTVFTFSDTGKRRRLLEL